MTGSGRLGTEPSADVVIAIHDATRRLDRALESLLTADDPIRITVVCHGIEASTVAGQVPADRLGRVRVVEFSDGIPSPEGPFNHGLDLATAPYVMIMGSDDFLEPGALTAWLAHARATHADVVLAPLRHQAGGLLLNPLARRGRRNRLDPVRDRLFYRSAPLGLLRRSVLDERGLRFTEGARTGGDLAVSCALWAADIRIDFDRRMPAYVIGADARTRVTTTRRPMRVLLEPALEVIRSDWGGDQSRAIRGSLATKLLRINVLGSVLPRAEPDAWSDDDLAVTRDAIEVISAYAPAGLHDLTRADRALIDELCRPDADATTVLTAIERHRRAGRVARTIPRRWTRAFSRESVLRRYAIYAVARWIP
ncbi:glycosyltransferase [Agromyces bauzanensis]